MTRSVHGIALAIVLVACGEEPAPAAPLPEASAVDLAEVAGPITGQLGDQAFTVTDARFRVVTYAGRERIDLLFDEHPIERCGLPLARTGARLWVRIPGATSLQRGERTLLDEEVAAADGAIEVHYERPGVHGYAEAHRAVARLEITSARPDRIAGRLHACFADGAHSCVAGAFVATPCLSRIDGRALREPPGLADDALAPLGGAPP